MSDAGGNYCYYTMIDAMIYKLSDNRSPQLSAQSQTPQFGLSFTKHPIVASDRWINSNYLLLYNKPDFILSRIEQSRYFCILSPKVLIVAAV